MVSRSEKERQRRRGCAGTAAPGHAVTVVFAGGGGGHAPTIPGLSRAYGVLNYTTFGLSKKDYLTIRNELYRDETGFRLGTPGTYSSHSVGLSHYFNDTFIVRPEWGYYRNWTNPAFDNGTKKGVQIYGLDVTIRF